jgi:hypothetical protein
MSTARSATFVEAADRREFCVITTIKGSRQ